ncbi:MAG: type I DNA topoisomerase [Geminicoccaceae bacterium]
MNVVVVESPTKAKTINKYLGDDYLVLSSYGHVRDLPEKDGSVLPDEDFRMIYIPLEDKKARIADIAKAVKKADRLYLATDPDREGEAISWHLMAALSENGALNGVDVKRVVFHEVTKRAVLDAVEHPRDVDQHLVDAYQARRALDYLVGFNLSPILWRKLQGSRSAGRVQSVALRLICERESEIEAFVPQEYWTVEADLKTADGAPFKARLTHLDGDKLDKFTLNTEAKAKAAAVRIEASSLGVDKIEKKKATRNPPPPFSTSTLQQEAARKLGFGTDRTMRTAQRLFEGINLGGETVGLITYMRTDSVQLSGDALNATRRAIAKDYGDTYLPEKPRHFRTKTKNAQEAHEAVRPTDPGRHPKFIAKHLDDDQRRLYDLIWKRTLASQMASAILDRVVIDIAGASLMLRANGSTIAFDGFLKLYQEGRDDPAADDDDQDRLLPPMAEGAGVDQTKVSADQHFTEPPPRFSEASLVRKLEALGVGRPSTYASIISVLQARDYVRLEQKRFVPEDRGRLVSAFLTAFFDRYVQPGFTAQLEDQLDDVAAGERFWKDVLKEFWDAFHGQVDEVKERRVAEVIDALNEALAPLLFPPRADEGNPRICPLCNDGDLSLKLGRYGAFVGCSNYPECKFTRKLGDPAEGNGQAAELERMLGLDPDNSEEVWLKVGRFGPYIQRGSGDEIKRSSLPPTVKPEEIELETALALLALPREVGPDPESAEPILAGINRYGPFVQRGRTYVRLQPDEDVLTIGMNRAVALLAEAPKGKARQAAKPAKEIGEHPDDNKPITLHEGRFGPYIKHGKLNASLPKGTDPETLSLEQALEILAKKAEKQGGKQAKTKPAKAKGGKASSAKKTAKGKSSTAKSKTKTSKKAPEPADG